MQPIVFTLRGTAPLMVNNPQTADRLNEWSQLIGELTGNKKRTDDEERQLQRLKWEASLYHDPDLGPYLPGIAAWKAIVEAGRVSRKGKQVERGLSPLTDKMPIRYDGPRDKEGMWAANRYADKRDAVPAGKRVMAVRGYFPLDWSVTLEAMFDRALVNERDLASFAELAGKIIGIGTYRQRFGRFTAEVKV
jgi:hypothetical protein